MAIAELTDPEDAKRVSGKVTQVSRKGCYGETPKTLPVGTSLKVIIFRDQRTFAAKANVIHVQEQMGMGLVFLNLPEDQLKILDPWLAGLPFTSAVGISTPGSCDKQVDAREVGYEIVPAFAWLASISAYFAEESRYRLEEIYCSGSRHGQPCDLRRTVKAETYLDKLPFSCHLHMPARK